MLQILKVNDTVLQTPADVTWALQDISSPNSGRTLDGVMHKDRVAQKVKLSCKWAAMPFSEASTLLKNVNSQVTFNLTYFDVMQNAERTARPSIEAGDVAYLTDPKGNRYKTIISNLTYEFGDYEKFSADAESKSDNQAALRSDSEKSTSALRADTGKAIDETNEKVDSLASDTTTSVASINENINLLRTNKVDTDFLQANYITAKDIKADYATVNNLTAATARISTLESTTVTADYLKANYITANDIKSNYATVENLNAANARIDSITSSTMTTDYLKAHYADISLSNIANGT